MIVRPALAGAIGRRGRLGGVSTEAWLATALLLVVWFAVSRLWLPPLLLPGPVEVARQLGSILSSPELLLNAGATFARVLAGLAGSFVLGAVIGTLMGSAPRLAGYLSTYLSFVQGIPSLCWVVIAIIWFRSPEFRVWFIVVMVTLPGFTFQIHDGYRSIPRDLKEMVRSLRPGRWQYFTHLTVPALIPPVLTIWKINLGGATHVVLVAELVGASLGIGYQLLSAEQLFNMAQVLAWTVVLIAFVFVTVRIVGLIESRLLRWRPDDAGGKAARGAVQ